MERHEIEVCFTPSMLAGIGNKPGRIVVVVDILRATTAICTAFGFGARSVLPLMDKEEALKWKELGWIVAGEEEGEKLESADFGNSPLEFRNPDLKGKDMAWVTTNGTRAIRIAESYGKVVIASFVNLEAVCGWLKKEGNDVLILCAGWKESFSLEDAVFAGAMADLMVNAYGFLPAGDPVLASIALWNQASPDLIKTVSRSAHYLRLLGIEDRNGLKYCFFPEKFHIVPVLEENHLKIVNE